TLEGHQERITIWHRVSVTLENIYWQVTVTSLCFTHLCLCPCLCLCPSGVHIYQLMCGCEWDDETGEKNGFFQHGYDGADLISFKPKERIWVAAKREAEITKHKWDQNEALIERWKSYFNQICIEWLQKFVNYGKKLPSVSLLQKTPSSPVSCHATGFYPDRELHEDVDHGEMLLNPDGTFQMSVDLNVSSVPPEDWSSYKCVFQLSGGKEITTTLDKNQIRTNWGETGEPLKVQ
uniref:MHC class I-like antigen recognition-like domain-containing protein n=1 Tax=Takifugu rubripes TaxID=31033 RepID=A0A674MXV3_TAKRU